MTVALQNFGSLEAKNKIAILGDMFELGDEANKEHQNIEALINTLNIPEAIFIGEHFHKALSSSSNKTFRTFDAFKNQFDIHGFKNATILIKGSRGMALERVLELL